MKHDKKMEEKGFPFKKLEKGKAEKEAHADKKMPKKAVKKIAKKGK
jgi:hypothetical protein